MSSTILEKVRRVAADVLGVPAEQIDPQSSPENVQTWDSVQHLNLVLALEEKFSVQLDPEEIDQMHDIGKVAAILEAKLNGFGQP